MEEKEKQQNLLDNFVEEEDLQLGETESGVPTGESPGEKPETVEEEVAAKENQEVTLDDLDNTPPSEKLRKIKADEKIEVKTLTIANVKLGKAITMDEKGELILPEVNSNGGKYYKAKLIVEFEEELNGDKIREFIPSIFYSVDENGNVNPVPTIPKACEDKKLTDNFTPELAKLRNKYAKFVGKDAKDVSSSEFVKGLVGKKFNITTESGEFKGRSWQKIKLETFVK